MEIFAYIDGQNLHLSLKQQEWILDYQRFFIYLTEKYHVTRAYLFLGFIQKNQNLYRRLQEFGYILIFKQVVTKSDGTVKGNCDAEMVLQIVSDYYEHRSERSILVSGDGDFACVASFLLKKNALEKILIPYQKYYSQLLRKFPSEYLAFVSDLRNKLEIKKNPVRTKP